MKIIKRILIALTMGLLAILLLVGLCLIGFFVHWVFTFFIPDPLIRLSIIVALVGLVTATISFFTDK